MKRFLTASEVLAVIDPVDPDSIDIFPARLSEDGSRITERFYGLNFCRRTPQQLDTSTWNRQRA